jgi:hypothetical protein
MVHSQSLKTIGHALESAKIDTFKIAKKDGEYRVYVDRVVFRYDSVALSRLRAAVKKSPSKGFLPGGRVRPHLAEQLRAVGDYIDRNEVDEFRIVWTRHFALLDYERADLEAAHRIFTAEELQELARRPTLPRSVSYLLPERLSRAL